MKKVLTCLVITIFLLATIIIQPVAYAKEEIPTGYQKSEDFELENLLKEVKELLIEIKNEHCLMRE